MGAPIKLLSVTHSAPPHLMSPNKTEWQPDVSHFRFVIVELTIMEVTVTGPPLEMVFTFSARIVV